MANLIKPNGSTMEVKPKNGRFFLLEELQNIVGGYTEGIKIAKNKMMYVNEDGEFTLKDSDINIQATQLATRFIRPGDYILGNAIIVPNYEESDYYD